MRWSMSFARCIPRTLSSMKRSMDTRACSRVQADERAREGKKLAAGVPDAGTRTTGKTSTSGSKQSKVLVLTGPTAVGKTSTSISLAKALDGEIISADSVQVYRGLDVGSAKITREEMSGVPHHCIDILDVHEEFSAGMFHSMAMELIEDILRRGKTPIVVGGTGFYLRWLVQGRPNTPMSTKESEEVVKGRLESVWSPGMDEGEKWDAGVSLVRSLGDAETAERLRVQERMNWYRMNRVLDILLQCPGKTLKDLDRESGGQGMYDFRCFFLVRERAKLYRRIDHRVELMVTNKLITETYEKLKNFIDVREESNQTCASRAIGYRQTLEWLAKGLTHDAPGTSFQVTEEEILQLTKEIQSASRQYSHKQMQWFRKEPAFRWLLIDDEGEGSTAEDIGQTIIDMFNAQAPSTEPDALKSHRMTKEEERRMRKYMTEMVVLKKGSDDLKAVVDEANGIFWGRSRAIR